MVIKSISHLVTVPKYQLPKLQKDAGLALQKEGITAFVSNKTTVKRNGARTLQSIGAIVRKLCPLHSLPSPSEACCFGRTFPSSVAA